MYILYDENYSMFSLKFNLDVRHLMYAMGWKMLYYFFGRQYFDNVRISYFQIDEKWQKYGL